MCIRDRPFTLPPLAALFASLVVCGIFAWVLGLILFKLKGTYFTFATIALVQVAFTFFNNYRPLFGGPDGINGIPTLSVGGAELSGYNHWFYFLVVLLVVLGIVVERIRRTQLGRSLASIRDNETAAMTLGVDIYHTKVIAFVIAGLLSGLAGALYAMNYNSIVPKKFDFNTSILVLVYVVLGGLGNIWGSIVATVVLYVLPEALRQFSDYRMLVYAIVLILVMLATNNPQVRTLICRIIPRRKGAALDE